MRRQEPITRARLERLNQLKPDASVEALLAAFLEPALYRGRDADNSRVNERVRRMMDRGLVDEAQRLYHDPRGLSEQAARAVGYAELFEHFAGRMTLDDTVERIKINSRRLGKHQRTWLRRFPAIRWIDVPEDESSIPPERILSLID